MSYENAHPAIARVLRGIVAAVMAAALIVGTASIMGCATDSATTDVSRDEYVEIVRRALYDFDQAAEQLLTEQREKLGPMDPDVPLTEENIATITDIADRFDERAIAALDAVLTVDAPEEIEQQAKAIGDYLQFTKDEIIPTLTGGIRAFKVGDTLNSFKESRLAEGLAGKAQRLQGEFNTALDELSVLGPYGSGEQASDTPTGAGE